MRKRAYRRFFIFTISLIILFVAVCPLSTFAVSDKFELTGEWYTRYESNNTVGSVNINYFGYNLVEFSDRNLTSSVAANLYGDSFVQWFSFTSSQLVTINPEWFYINWTYTSIASNIASVVFYIVPYSYDMATMPLAGPAVNEYGYMALYRNIDSELVLQEEYTNTELTSGAWKCLVVYYYSSSQIEQDLYIENLYVANGRGDLQGWIYNNISPELGLDAEEEEIKDAIEELNTGPIDDLFNWYSQFELGQYLVFGSILDDIIDGTGLGVVYNFALVAGFCGLLIGTIAIIARRFKR